MIPAEMYMERPNVENDLNYCWVIYQPDVPGQPEYISGKHWNKEKASRDADIALRNVWRSQGYVQS